VPSLRKSRTKTQPPHTYLRAAEFKRKKCVTLRPHVRKRDLNITALYSGEYYKLVAVKPLAV
jgi:hypothetical protein